jgi:glutathione S-transferase
MFTLGKSISVSLTPAPRHLPRVVLLAPSRTVGWRNRRPRAPSAAIILTLGERHPCALVPAPGEQDRPEFLRWLIYMAASPYMTFVQFNHPYRFLDDPATHAALIDNARSRLLTQFFALEEAIAGEPFFLPRGPSALDLYLYMLVEFYDDRAGLFAGGRGCKPCTAPSRRARARAASARRTADPQVGQTISDDRSAREVGALSQLQHRWSSPRMSRSSGAESVAPRRWKTRGRVPALDGECRNRELSQELWLKVLYQCVQSKRRKKVHERQASRRSGRPRWRSSGHLASLQRAQPRHRGGRSIDRARAAMSWNPAIEPGCPDEVGIDAIETLIVPRSRDLGGFEVRRALPAPKRQMVGPFIFFDQAGPAELLTGQGVDVRPHPHIGLGTVTYLFKRRLPSPRQHRRRPDHQPRRAELDGRRARRHPFGAHLRGARSGPNSLFGIQTWLALPDSHEDVAPSFEHHGKETLPVIEDAASRFGSSSATPMARPRPRRCSPRRSTPT